ncbi:hypothetical protein [Kribbella endophytica]
MSTPNEGPGLQWTQGDVAGAARALSELNAREQQALGRVIRAAAAVGPIINGVARGIRVIRQTMTRLSERAVQLASAGRALGQTAVGNVRQTASNVSERTSNRATELGQQASEAVGRARDGALNARDWTVDQTVGMTQRAAEGLSAAGRGAANAGRAVVEAGQNAGRAVADAGRSAVATGQDLAGRAADAGRQGLAAGQELAGRAAEAGRQGLAAGQELAGRAADAGRQGLAAGQAAAGQAVAAGQAAAGRAGRWFNQQVSRGAAKASASLAGLAARRSDPTLTSPDQKLQKRDVLLAQKAAELFTSPDNQRAAKAAELAAFIQNEYGGEQKVNLEKSGGPEQSVDAGARTTAASHQMAWVLNANKPATEMRAPGATGEQPTSTQGEQATGRHTKKEGPNQNGPSIGG